MEYNNALTERRVARSKNFLVEQGVPAASIETRSLGKQQLLSTAQVKQQMENNPKISQEGAQRFYRQLNGLSWPRTAAWMSS